MPADYARLTQRRALWKDFGMTPENTTHAEWEMALLALRLEQKYTKAST